MIFWCVQIILSTMDAGYGFLCAEYSEKSRADPRELRVKLFCRYVVRDYHRSEIVAQW